MKIEFIKRGAATRLILIFAGWSTDARYYNDCVADGWDTAVVSDYRDLKMPPVPAQYSTVYVFAYSLGVAAAARCGVTAAVRIAICGSTEPVSDQYGIPSAVYQGTLNGMDERNLAKFHLRMAGDKKRYADISCRLPLSSDIEALKEELAQIRSVTLLKPTGNEIGFDRVYLAEDDRIFPYENLLAFWKQRKETSVVTMKAPHAVDMASIVRDCLPDTVAIGEGFKRAGKSYNEHALIQREICRRMVKRLTELLPPEIRTGGSLLEIGPGQGLLTEEYRNFLHPKYAVFVDLADIPCFGVAEEETYLQSDAEEWLERTAETFDIILSASTIQWFADPIRFISTVRKHLNPGGLAILSTFVKGNLEELYSVRTSPILYRAEGEYNNAEVSECETWSSSLQFASSREMMMHLRQTGVSPRRLEPDRHEKHNGSPAPLRLSELPTELTYRPLIVVVKN